MGKEEEVRTSRTNRQMENMKSMLEKRDEEMMSNKDAWHSVYTAAGYTGFATLKHCSDRLTAVAERRT